MTLAQLRETLRTHVIDDKVRRDMLIELHRRFSLPFACFVFALVGVPLGIQNQRSGKGAGFSISIGVILIYYVVLSAGKTLGAKRGRASGHRRLGPRHCCSCSSARTYSAKRPPNRAFPLLNSPATSSHEPAP